MGELIRSAPVWLLGLVLLIATIACAYAGTGVNRWLRTGSSDEDLLSDSQQSFVVSSIFALLALMMAFTFSLAMDRFQARKQLVVEEATAIEGLYLKAQLLDEPDRTRISQLLLRYAQNHVDLAKMHRSGPEAEALLAQDDGLVRDLWAATVPAFQHVRTIDFSSSFVDAVGDVVKVGAERKAQRRSQIPTTIILALLFYALVSAAVLGAVMRTARGRQFGIAMLALNILVLMLITDINRPVEGTIRESQEPMERMLARLKANPPSASQRLNEAPVSATDATSAR